MSKHDMRFSSCHLTIHFLNDKSKVKRVCLRVHKFNNLCALKVTFTRVFDLAQEKNGYRYHPKFFLTFVLRNSRELDDNEKTRPKYIINIALHFITCRLSNIN